jgi:hypothetical protein
MPAAAQRSPRANPKPDAPPVTTAISEEPIPTLVMYLPLAGRDAGMLSDLAILVVSVFPHLVDVMNHAEHHRNQ